MLLEEYFKEEKAPSFYAEKLHITLKHLNRICNEILQKTATEVITDRVVLEIKRMLIDSIEKAKQINPDKVTNPAQTLE